MRNIYEEIWRIYSENKEGAVCTVVSTKGSTPAGTGAKMIVYADKTIYGTIGGGSLEKKVMENAAEVLQTGSAKLFRHDLLHHHEMCCGGTVDIFIEPVMKLKKLYIFGSGHVGQALARHAKALDFEIVMIDDRKEYLDQIQDESISKMNLPYQQALPLLPFDTQTYICIMTYSHPHDREILAYCLKKHFAYLGMIGSRRKVEVTKKMFREAGIATEAELETVDMPMGIDIKAQNPDEIAISILSRIIMIKNTVAA